MTAREHDDVHPLDAVEREAVLARTVRSKPALRMFYEDMYARFAACVEEAPGAGVVLEIGSGGGFLRERLPDVVTSDVLAYRGVDVVLDARRMPFADGALRAVLALNVLHHVPDVHALFAELRRCLRPGGRALFVEPWPGVPGKLVYRFVHHEPFEPQARSWAFPSTGPLSGANGALPWIVFARDRALFTARYPELRVLRCTPHTPLLYWASGGLSPLSLAPTRRLARVVRAADRALTHLSSHFASFVDVELVRA